MPVQAPASESVGDEQPGIMCRLVVDIPAPVSDPVFHGDGQIINDRLFDHQIQLLPPVESRAALEGIVVQRIQNRSGTAQPGRCLLDAAELGLCFLLPLIVIVVVEVEKRLRWLRTQSDA